MRRNGIQRESEMEETRKEKDTTGTILILLLQN